MAQALALLFYTEKSLITNEVTEIFSVYPRVASLTQAQFTFTPFKSISYTLHALPTEDSRLNSPDWLHMYKPGIMPAVSCG